jgi:hypothetical protein
MACKQRNNKSMVFIICCSRVYIYIYRRISFLQISVLYAVGDADGLKLGRLDGDTVGDGVGNAEFCGVEAPQLGPGVVVELSYSHGAVTPYSPTA